MNRVRVMIVDDHELVRQGLRTLLDADENFEVVAEAASGREAIAALSRQETDLALIDIRLPDLDGIELCRSILERHPGIRCAIFTSSGDADQIEAAREAGAAAYLLKGATRAALVASIRRAGEGSSPAEFPRPRRGEGAIRSLTEAERRVLTLIGEGLSDRQIGSILHVAPKTISNYVSAIYAKLGVSGRVQAAGKVASSPAWSSRDFA